MTDVMDRSVWAALIDEHGDPFHMFSFLPWHPADFLHDDYVRRWYWYHGSAYLTMMTSWPNPFTQGDDADRIVGLFQQRIPFPEPQWEVTNSGEWELPDYKFGQLIPGRDCYLDDRFPPETSPWTLESMRLERMRPVSETLRDLLDDENLIIEYKRPRDDSEKRQERIGRAWKTLDDISALLRRMGVDLADDPPKMLPAAPQPQEITNEEAMTYPYGDQGTMAGPGWTELTRMQGREQK